MDGVDVLSATPTNTTTSFMSGVVGDALNLLNATCPECHRQQNELKSLQLQIEDLRHENKSLREELAGMILIYKIHFDDLMQKKCNSSVLTMELHFFYR